MKRRGFTLVEILVVIGIITILLSIIIPVVGKIRTAARVAAAQAQLNGLSLAIQSYYQDHSAYPGPLTNDELRLNTFNVVQNVSVNPPTGYETDIATTRRQITGSENLVLGLLGGLALEGTPAAPRIVYNPSLVGSGANNLNFGQQKRFKAYIEAANLSWREDVNGKTGHFKDGAGEATDSIIPEIVDTFPAPMPILYLRARKGFQGATASMTPNNNPVITNNADPATNPRGHYDVNQYVGYTMADATGSYIGEEKKISRGDYAKYTPTPGKWPHGLGDPNNAPLPVVLTASMDKGSPDYQHPYNAFSYFKNPSSSSTEPQPRQKDGYILIGAGLDRVYGTEDDITSFGAVTQ